MNSGVLSDIKYETKTSIFRSDKTRTANVLNCFKDDRSSKFNWRSNFQKIRCVSRENQR
jgi:hypothetical protein